MKTPSVILASWDWTRRGHSLSQETDYSIWLNGLRLRGFSTHGDMIEGYWGREAKAKAESYAADIAKELGVPVIRARLK